jgi:hypothetical protein
VPALDELRAALGAWCRENDATPRLADRSNAELPAGRQPPTQAELAAVAATLTAWCQGREQREAVDVEAKPPIKRTRQNDLALLGNLKAQADAGAPWADQRLRALRLRLEGSAA